MWKLVYGTPSYDDVFNLPSECYEFPPALVISTPRCVNYSTGATDQRGEQGGNDGWQWVKQVQIIIKLNPKTVLLEMVANAVNYEEELQKVLSPLVQHG